MMVFINFTNMIVILNKSTLESKHSFIAIISYDYVKFTKLKTWKEKAEKKKTDAYDKLKHYLMIN